jgi:DNA-binding GntR family transcriptional regulator
MTERNKSSLADAAYRKLLKKIITLELPPGEALDEKRLIAELGVSRTPLREAVARLKRDRLVIGEKNQTSYVQRLNLDSFRNLSETLLIVEKNITAMAAQRATPSEVKRIEKALQLVNYASEKGNHWGFIEHNREFHKAVSRASHNEILEQIHSDVRRQVQRLAYISVNEDFEGICGSLYEHNSKLTQHHIEIFESIRDHNPKRAEAASIKHITSFHNRMMAYYQYLFHV